MSSAGSTETCTTRWAGELTNSPFQRSGRWALKMRASWLHIGLTRVRWASQLSKTF